MTQKFNNSTGTTSSEFQLAAGTGNEVRQFVLTAEVLASSAVATDRFDNEIAVGNIEFFDLKIVAKTSGNSIVAKNLRGTITGTTVTRIEDIFQEDFTADVVLSVNSSLLVVECTSAVASSFIIYATLIRVA